jgi:hypothetical protein
MSVPMIPPYTVRANSVTATSPSNNTTSAAVALPVGSDGQRTRYVKVTTQGFTQINFGQAGVTASQSTSQAIANQWSETFNVQGFTHFAVIQPTPSTCVVTPLEDF